MWKYIDGKNTVIVCSYILWTAGAAHRGVGEPYDKIQNPNAKTGSAGARGAKDQQQCERYGLVATPGCAGMFRMSVLADAVCEQEGKCLIQFTVWKMSERPRLRRLWFTVKHAMRPAVAAAVRALEVWTDRKNNYHPAKIVFLQK